VGLNFPDPDLCTIRVEAAGVLTARRVAREDVLDASPPHLGHPADETGHRRRGLLQQRPGKVRLQRRLRGVEPPASGQRLRALLGGERLRHPRIAILNLGWRVGDHDRDRAGVGQGHGT
jgi:hypothetical protein